MSERGEEAGAQTPDLMNKNRVARHGARGKLASDSDAQKGPERLDVDAAGLGGKISNLIRGDLRSKAEVSRSRSSRWSNDHPGRAMKVAYRAKGRTDKELSERRKVTARTAEN